MNLKPYLTRLRPFAPLVAGALAGFGASEWNRPEPEPTLAEIEQRLELLDRHLTGYEQLEHARSVVAEMEARLQRVGGTPVPPPPK